MSPSSSSRTSHSDQLNSTWRPLVPRVEERPIAVCDFQSIDPRDLLATARIFPHRMQELYFLRHNPSQRFTTCRNKRQRSSWLWYSTIQWELVMHVVSHSPSRSYKLNFLKMLRTVLMCLFMTLSILEEVHLVKAWKRDQFWYTKVEIARIESGLPTRHAS